MGLRAILKKLCSEDFHDLLQKAVVLQAKKKTFWHSQSLYLNQEACKVPSARKEFLQETFGFLDLYMEVYLELVESV